MSFSEDATGEIHRNRDKKKAGGFNSIPFALRRFQHFVPGVQKSNYVILTAGPGIGKTKIAKNMYVFRPYDFVQSHPAAGIKFTTLYFCLEEPGRVFMQSVMCYRLKIDHKIRVSIKELRSQLDPEDPTAIVSDDILDKVNAMKPWLKEFEESVILIDDVRKPYAIYKRCQEYLESVGDWTMKPGRVYDPKKGEMVSKIVRDKYHTLHPDHYIQVVVDHMSLLEPEKGQDLFEAIRMLSNVYFVRLRNVYGCSILAVQQQMAEKEKQQYTYKGASVESKLEPSMDGLGDCKLTARDADEILGVFAPDKFEIKDHRDYDITILRDNYRSLSVLKSRDGEPNKRLGLFFDGATNYIAELPPPDKMTKKDYQKVLDLVGRIE